MATNSKAYNKKHYKEYWGNKPAIKDRAERNRARASAMKAWKVKKGDGKEIDHKKPLSKWWAKSNTNTRVLSMKTNRRLGAAIANKRKGKWYKKDV